MAINIGEAVAYLNLDMTSFNVGIQNAKSALDSFGESSTTLSRGLGAIGSVASNVGSTLTEKVSIPLLNLGSSSLDAYRSFESAFTGVRKTMDDTAVAAIGGYDVLSDAIKKMSFETASSAEDIAYVMEIAGQLGVPLGDAGNDVINFTKTMVEMGDSTNLSAEEAATALAQFMNIAGTSWEDVGRLGSTIVDLGNNFATTESDITYMAQRLASAGTVAGLTETDILALSTAMSSVGIKAEAGGSAMAQTLAQIEKIVQKAISGDEGAIGQLEKLGIVSGMTADEFANAWQNDPMTALQNFLLGMGQLEDKGESAVLVLDDLKMSGIRQSNMLKALGLAGGVLADSIDTANKAWEENTALSVEAEKRYGTLDSRISQLNERWKDMKRDIAEILVPVLEKLMDIAEKLIGWFKNLSDEQKEFIVKIAATAAAIGPLLLVFGNLMQTIGLGVQSFSIIKTAIINFKEALSLSQAGFVNFAGVASKVFTLFSNFNPVILAVVAGIALLVAGFVKAYNESEEFRNAVSQLFSAIGKLFEYIAGYVMSTLEALQPIISVLIEIAAKLLEAILPPLVTILTTLVEVIGNILNAIAPVLELIGQIIGVILELLMPVIQSVIDNIANVMQVISEMAQVVGDVLNLIVGLVTGNGELINESVSSLWEHLNNLATDSLKFLWELFFGWFDDLLELFGTSKEELLQDIGDFVSNALQKFQDWWQNVKQGFSDFWNGTVDGTKEFLRNIKEDISNKLDEIKDKAEKFWQDVKEGTREFVDNVKEKIGTKLDEIKQKAEKHWQDIKSGVKDFNENVKEKVSSTYEDLKKKAADFFDGREKDIANFFTNAFKKINEKLKEIWDKISGWFEDLGGDFFDWGKNLFSKLWSGLKSKWEQIWGWLKGIWDKVSGLFSDIKGGFQDAFSGFGWNGSHANGLDYVPFDGYVAQLHKGERVLTKQENEDYNSGNQNNGTGGDVYNFYNTKPDPYEYARQMKRVKKELQPE